MNLADYITIKQAAEQWGVSPRAVSYNVTDGRIPGAIKVGTMWLIPATAQKPFDERRNNHQHPNKRGDGGA
jgi:excisionase family DNA binding protein